MGDPSAGFAVVLPALVIGFLLFVALAAFAIRSVHRCLHRRRERRAGDEEGGPKDDRLSDHDWMPLEHEWNDICDARGGAAKKPAATVASVPAEG